MTWKSWAESFKMWLSIFGHTVDTVDIMYDNIETTSRKNRMGHFQTLQFE